jgi:hypothetical protein
MATQNNDIKKEENKKKTPSNFEIDEIYTRTPQRSRI